MSILIFIIISDILDRVI